VYGCGEPLDINRANLGMIRQSSSATLGMVRQSKLRQAWERECTKRRTAQVRCSQHLKARSVASSSSVPDSTCRAVNGTCRQASFDSSKKLPLWRHLKSSK